MNPLSAIGSSAQRTIGPQLTADHGTEISTESGADKPFAKLLHQRQMESKARLNADLAQRASAKSAAGPGPAKIDPKDKVKPQTLPLKASGSTTAGDMKERMLAPASNKPQRAEGEHPEGTAMPTPPAPITQTAPSSPPTTTADPRPEKAPTRNATSASKLDAGTTKLTHKLPAPTLPGSKTAHDPTASFKMLMNIDANPEPQGPPAGITDAPLTRPSGKQDLQFAINMPTMLAGLSPAAGDLPTADLLNRLEAGAQGDAMHVGSVAEPGSLAALSMPTAVSGNPTPEAPAAMTIPTPVQAPEFREALAAQVTLLTKDGIQEATLQLNPTDLGPIAIHISLDGTQARVDFAVNSPITRDIIASSMPDLANAMRDAGLTFTGGGVSQNSSGGARQGSGGGTGRPHGRHTALGNNVGAPTGPIRTLNARVGSLDLYA